MFRRIKLLFSSDLSDYAIGHSVQGVSDNVTSTLHYLAYKLATRFYQANDVGKPYNKNFHITGTIWNFKKNLFYERNLHYNNFAYKMKIKTFITQI